MEVNYDEAKFTEMLLYVADKLRDDKAGGATKLNKVLYFADFAHVRQHGRPITGADYQKLQHGPAPRRVLPVRQQLIESGDAEMLVEDFLGHQTHRFVPRRDADLGVFDNEELATIDSVLADLEGMTGTQVSDLSHDEPWWPLFDEGDTIPFHVAFIPKRQIVTPTARQMAEDVAKRYGIVADR